jgi:hypothetical protein
MSDPPDPNERAERAEPSEEPPENRALRNLVKRSLSGDAMGIHAPDLLPGVQKRIRRRSSGKFFGDGWSTTQARASYVLVALVTLLLVALAFFALGPMDMR